MFYIIVERKSKVTQVLYSRSSLSSRLDKYTSNWDVERIAFMDNLIISIAIAELTNFDSIPVKVTLDEWIDIAKYYSSPTSSNFVNGVLDKIVAELTESGRIKKSGRGLL